MFKEKQCKDIELLGSFPAPENPVCEDCVAQSPNPYWVHLRTCQSCGMTLCCDSSPNQHMTAHHHATGHPAAISAERGEQWIYCYEHDVFATY
jgi:hypothetical protein